MTLKEFLDLNHHINPERFEVTDVIKKPIFREGEIAKNQFVYVVECKINIVLGIDLSVEDDLTVYAEGDKEARHDRKGLSSPRMAD